MPPGYARMRRLRLRPTCWELRSASPGANSRAKCCCGPKSVRDAWGAACRSVKGSAKVKAKYPSGRIPQGVVLTRTERRGPYTMAGRRTRDPGLPGAEICHASGTTSRRSRCGGGIRVSRLPTFTGGGQTCPQSGEDFLILQRSHWPSLRACILYNPQSRRSSDGQRWTSGAGAGTDARAREGAAGADRSSNTRPPGGVYPRLGHVRGVRASGRGNLAVGGCQPVP